MNAVCLPFTFDPDRILDALAGFPAEATREIQSSYITPGGLLGVDLLTPLANAATQSGDLQMAPTAALAQAPYLQEILATFDSRKFLYRVHYLQPGAHIQPHHDGMGPHLGQIRVHIPVRSHGQSSFVLAGEALRMAPGSCWFLDVSQVHEVRNDGAEARVHLVMDCEYNDWWKAVLRDAGYRGKGEGPYGALSLEDLGKMRDLLRAEAGEGKNVVLAEVEAEIMLRKNS